MINKRFTRVITLNINDKVSMNLRNGCTGNGEFKIKDADIVIQGDYDSFTASSMIDSFFEGLTDEQKINTINHLDRQFSKRAISFRCEACNEFFSKKLFAIDFENSFVVCIYCGSKNDIDVVSKELRNGGIKKCLRASEN